MSVLKPKLIGNDVINNLPAEKNCRMHRGQIREREAFEVVVLRTGFDLIGNLPS